MGIRKQVFILSFKDMDLYCFYQFFLCLAGRIAFNFHSKLYAKLEVQVYVVCCQPTNAYNIRALKKNAIFDLTFFRS